MPDQEQDVLAGFAVELQASTASMAIRTLSSAWSSSRHLPTSWRRRQHQQLRSIELAEDVAETQSIRALGRRDAFQVADREHVLVDGMLVVEVAHHAPRDRLEFREHAPSRPQSCISDSRS